jgi:hypothetical protein
MRITRDSLLQIARDTAAERVRLNRRIVCIYLTGSLLRSDPFLGGMTDIDLFIIHDGQPSVDREVVSLGDEVHLDIAHLSQEIFRQPRQMRTEPWISPFIVDHPRVYHDTQHWFEFTQAAISAQFHQAGNVVQRGRACAALARRTWRTLSTGSGGDPGPDVLHLYFKVLEQAANAIASLSGSPLTERRLLLDFPQRALAIGKAELSSGLVSLAIPQAASDEAWPACLQAFKEALQATDALPGCPPQISAPRHAYYLRAAAALREKTPAAAQWVILNPWMQALRHLPAGSVQLDSWRLCAPALGLDGPTFHARLAGLDAYLDGIEEALDQWSRSNGG